MSFARQPQLHPLRKCLFQIHLWLGLILAIYVIVIGLTGSILVYRGDLQKLTFPEFFTVERHGQSDAPLNTILAELQHRYPGTKVSGFDYPTPRRQTFLTYLTRGNDFLTVFSNPVTAQIVGELPKTSWITHLQDLHYDLLGGRIGRKVSSIAAGFLIAMCVSGLILWWPGTARWIRGLWVDTRAGWRRINWDLHSVTGFWTLTMLLMWAISGVQFGFPQMFRQTVNAISPLTTLRDPQSNPIASGSTLGPASFIERARMLVSGAEPALLVMPSGASGSVLVQMAPEGHRDLYPGNEISLYFDQYTGALLERRAASDQGRSSGDLIVKWLGPLHTASFGGPVIRILWALLGLSFPILAITGFLMWRNRLR